MPLVERCACPAVFKGFDLAVNRGDQVIVLPDAGTEYGSEKVEVLFHSQVLGMKTPGM